jgi:hypothetical protein
MPLELHTILYQQFNYPHPEPFMDLISHMVIHYYPNSQVAYNGVIKTKRVNWDTYEFSELITINLHCSMTSKSNLSSSSAFQKAYLCHDESSPWMSFTSA